MNREDLGFWNWARRDPHRIALIDPEEKKVTFGELYAAANQVAHGLRALGLEAGDGVAVLLPNSVPVYEIYMGAVQVGLYFTPINHHLAVPEVAYVLEDCEAKAFFVHEAFGESASSAIAVAGYEPDRPRDHDQGRLQAGQARDTGWAKPCSLEIRCEAFAVGAEAGLHRLLVEVEVF